MQEQQKRREQQRRWRHGPLEHRHLEHQSANTVGPAAGGEQTHVRTERHSAEDGLFDAQLVGEGEDLIRVGVDPVGRRVLGLVAATMPDQIEQDYPVATSGESLGDAPVELRVDQQAVQVDDDSVALPVVVVDQTVAAEGER